MRPPVLALLALLLAAPLAGALHPFPTPEERLRDGADLSVHVIFTGRAGASGSAEDDQRDDEGKGSLYRDSYAWSSSWDWTATGNLGSASGPGPGIVMREGNVTISLRDEGHRRTTVERGGPNGPEAQTTTADIVTTCSASGRVRGVSQGSFRIEGDELVLRFGAPPAPPMGSSCTVTVDETNTHGDPRHRSERTNRLYDVAFSTKVRGDDEVELRVPVAAGKTILTGTFSEPLPAGNEGLAGQLCGRFSAMTDLVAPCEARETIEVRLFAGVCKAAEASARRHRAELDAAAGRAPQGSDEGALLAWADDVAARTAALLSDERAHQLAGCTPPMEGNGEAVVRALTAVRDALGTAAKEGKLTQEGEQRLLGAERHVQLLGGQEASGDAAAGIQAVAVGASAYSGAGTATVRVHSPVALRAVAPDGRVVGWNATSNASESAVPGSSADGEPGGAQRLTLPPGVWHVEVAEQEFAGFLLVLEGPDGREEAHLMQALPGRATRLPIALADDGDGMRLHLYAPTRTGAAAQPGAAGIVGTPGDTASETPAGWAPLLALALVGAALARRR